MELSFSSDLLDSIPINEYLTVKASSKEVGTEGYKSRGIYASKNIKEGQVILLSITTPVSEDGSYIERYNFYNPFTEGRLIAETGGGLFNHSEDYNVDYKIIKNPELGYLVEFKSTKEIQKGSELLINYGYEVKQ